MRHFNPYELTQLAKYGVSLDQANQAGLMPVEYITGHVSFNNLDLLVNPDVLIPRVETEGLAHRARKIANLINASKLTPESLNILDLGTGCGAVAIYLAVNLPKDLPAGSKLTIVASDISPQALVVASQNASRCLSDQAQTMLRFILSDLWQNINVTQKFDLVIANLPYIPSARIQVLDESVKNFEPWLALDGGVDGLDLIGKMLDVVPNFLSTHGTILLEVDYTHDLNAFKPWLERFEITADVDEFLRQRFITCRLR